MASKSNQKITVTEIPEPPVSKLVFANVRLAPLWLLARFYVGYLWFIAGWEKIESPVWVGPHAGAAVKGFAMGALKKASGEHPDVTNWYATFLQGFVLHHVTLISNIVAYGEVAVGILLILGLFTGIASFFGAFMNMNYLFAGTVSINPVMFVLELLIILAWRTAGWIGLDKYILPLLGTPWFPGNIFKKKNQ
jgi:thiosulfate dehydrogenase [quinone] large subunit